MYIDKRKFKKLGAPPPSSKGLHWNVSHNCLQVWLWTLVHVFRKTELFN